MRLKDTFAGFFRRPDIPPADSGEYLAFLRRYQRRTTPAALVVGSAIMLALLVVDAIVLSDIFLLSLVGRVLIAFPISVAAWLYLVHAPDSRHAHDAVLTGLPVLFAAVSCFAISRSSEPLAMVYLTANNTTIMFAMLMLGLTPSAAIGTAVTIIVVQTIAVGTSAFADTDLILLITTISICALGAALFGNWRMDADRRRQFLSRKRDRELLADLSARNALLEHLSALDPLTALANRRGFEATLRGAIEERALAEADEVVALAMIDVDHFKLYNDSLGHPAGDRALQDIGQALSRSIGENELVARYGGEEFVVVLPRTKARALDMTAARLRVSVERLAIPHPTSPTARILTISVGVAFAERSALWSSGRTKGSGRLVEIADEALYAAKAKGRNAVVVLGYPAQDAPISTPRLGIGHAHR